MLENERKNRVIEDFLHKEHGKLQPGALNTGLKPEQGNNNNNNKNAFQ